MCGIYKRGLGVATQTALNSMIQKDCNHIAGGPILSNIMSRASTDKSARFYRGARIAGEAAQAVTSSCAFGEYAKNGGDCVSCNCLGMPCNTNGVCIVNILNVSFALNVKYEELFGSPADANKIELATKDIKAALVSECKININNITGVSLMSYVKPTLAPKVNRRAASDGDIEVIVFSNDQKTLDAIAKKIPFRVKLTQTGKTATTQTTQTSASESEGSSSSSSSLPIIPIAAAIGGVLLIVIIVVIVVISRRKSGRRARAGPSAMISFDNPTYRDEEPENKTAVRGLENPIYQTSSQVVQNPVYDGVSNAPQGNGQYDSEVVYDGVDANQTGRLPEESGYLDVSPDKPSDSYAGQDNVYDALPDN
jgi:hypothetical protein